MRIVQNSKRFLARFMLLLLLATTLPPVVAGKRLPDVTGIHVETLGCSPDLPGNSTLGTAYKDKCFDGFVDGATIAEYKLVQNGQQVCGEYSACSGRNCDRIDTSAVVGKIQGRDLTLYWTDGRLEHGYAEAIMFRISSFGELWSPTSGKRVFQARRGRLKHRSDFSQCAPAYEVPVPVENYQLKVGGRWPASMAFTQVQPGKRVHAPPAIHVTITAASPAFSVRDGKRESSNLVPRDVLIRNNSKQAWQLSVPENEETSCMAYLNDQPEHQKKPTATKSAFSNAYGRPVVAAHSRVWTKICPGGLLTLEPTTLSACEMFYCIENCKC